MVVYTYTWMQDFKGKGTVAKAVLIFTVDITSHFRSECSQNQAKVKYSN
jgi:hypothetical protein